jgi:predicted MFS family arabinose efflux permease
MMFDGLGATLATLPVGVIDARIGWRGTFLLLAVVSLAASVSIFTLVPRLPITGGRLLSRGFISAVTDRRLLRGAPLSHSVVGTSFAVHGLGATRWLKDVNPFAPNGVFNSAGSSGRLRQIDAIQ